MLYQAKDDPELRNWLIHNAESQNQFICKLIEAAKLAAPGEYTALQPVLRKFRACDPEPDSSIRVLSTDRYKAVFHETNEIHELDGDFARLNFTAFGNELPEVRIRYATSIISMSPQKPGQVIGLFASPDDPCTYSIPGQFKIDVPHIFITEKLRGISPVNELVLLHEMCHYQVHHHGREFIDLIKQALDATNWRVITGGFGLDVLGDLETVEPGMGV